MPTFEYVKGSFVKDASGEMVYKTVDVPAKSFKSQALLKQVYEKLYEGVNAEVEKANVRPEIKILSKSYGGTGKDALAKTIEAVLNEPKVYDACMAKADDIRMARKQKDRAYREWNKVMCGLNRIDMSCNDV
jgi:signal recognition particle GTPase